MKITEFDLKWVHMARYELILRLDGALWLTIISKPPLTQKEGHGMTKKSKRIQHASGDGGQSMHPNK